MHKLAEIKGYMQDMCAYQNSKNIELDGIAKQKGEELHKANGKKKKELTAVLQQLHKEGTDALMYAAYAESMCEMCDVMAQFMGIDIDKEVEQGKLERLQKAKEEDERSTN